MTDLFERLVQYPLCPPSESFFLKTSTPGETSREPQCGDDDDGVWRTPECARRSWDLIPETTPGVVRGPAWHRGGSVSVGFAPAALRLAALGRARDRFVLSRRRFGSSWRRCIPSIFPTHPTGSRPRRRPPRAVPAHRRHVPDVPPVPDRPLDREILRAAPGLRSAGGRCLRPAAPQRLMTSRKSFANATGSSRPSSPATAPSKHRSIVRRPTSGGDYPRSARPQRLSGPDGRSELPSSPPTLELRRVLSPPSDLNPEEEPPNDPHGHPIKRSGLGTLGEDCRKGRVRASTQSGGPDN